MTLKKAMQSFFFLLRIGTSSPVTFYDVTLQPILREAYADPW